jgi:hypothetical protein
MMPPGVSQPGLVYDLATKKVLLFGGATQSQAVFYNQVWAYDVATKSWTHKALSSPAPPFEYVPTDSRKIISQPEMAYDPVHRKMYYHQVAGTGGPADWQYDPVADTWVRLTSIGTGATRDAAMSFDVSCNCIVTMSNANGTGTPPEMWIGAIGSSTSETTTALPLASPFVVKVTDTNGNPVSGVPVTFNVTSGGGRLAGGVTQLVVNSNAQGLASVSFTVGPNPGVNTVTASSGTLTGSPITFTATGGSGAANACDLNGDGSVNFTDVQAAISQALGLAACANADLDGSGCSVVDVQRVVNASQGGTCRTGQ